MPDSTVINRQCPILPYLRPPAGECEQYEQRVAERVVGAHERLLQLVDHGVARTDFFSIFDIFFIFFIF